LAAKAMKLGVSRLELSCPTLPEALDGFTILHLSDPHLEALPAFGPSVLSELESLEADIAVVTGDFQIDEDLTDLDRTMHLVRPLIAAMRTRLGIFATLGNHDSWRVVDPLEALGVRMLINEHVIVGEGERALQLVGIDDVHTFFTEDAVEAVQSADGGFRVLLAHTPEIAGLAAAAGYGLYLAGHTHGGQVCLPNGRPLLTGLDTHQDLASGHWQIGAMHGYTNRGLGVASTPLRINCPAEIAILRLRAAPG
jgi:predicted MPP superfamily phosphohydrolase